MDRDDLELFERSVRHATERDTGTALDAALEELGWHDALAIDPRVAVTTLFELQGAANVTSSALGHVVRSGLGIDAGMVVLPLLGQSTPPGVLRDGRVEVTGLLTSGDGSALVVARGGDKDVAVLLAPDDLDRRPIDGIDPWLGLAAVTADVEAADHGPVDWNAAVALARLALAHELVGASRRMLELAREHALEREQFGQPISAFQAVRHRLAETLIAIETADAVIGAAWQDGSPQTAAMAKALAGRGARTAARHCQQVLAGIGFTTEHPLHRYVRRILVLDELFGAARTLTKQLGDELLRTGELPPPLPL